MIKIKTSVMKLVESAKKQINNLEVSDAIKMHSNKTNLFGYKNSDLGQFNLANIELLIKKKLLQKNLIKPIYLS